MILSPHHTHRSRRSLGELLEHYLHEIPGLRHLKITKEWYLIVFFGGLFFLIFLRLFWLEIVQHGYYEGLLNNQHVSQSLLKAKRGNIYAYDKSGKPVQLTENISMYNLVVDPKFVWNKERFIDIITPVVYQHLCELHGMDESTQMSCISNIQEFTKKELLPKRPVFFYYGSGLLSTGYRTFDWTGYNQNVANAVSGFSPSLAKNLIKNKLQDMIFIGIKPKNYLGFFPDTSFLEELQKLHLDYISLEGSSYVYIIPQRIASVNREIIPLQQLLAKYGYLQNFPNLSALLRPQENRYVKLISDANPLIAQQIKELKLEYYTERNKDKIPLLHGLGLEASTRRYYEYGDFLSNILGMVDKNGNAFYGIEQYFDPVLHGKDGKIIGRSSSWIGNVGANDFQIDHVVDGQDIYLTIDIGIQKELELLAKKYQESLRADSVSLLVYDPFNGTIKGSANYPSFDPNNYNDSFELKAVGWEERYLLDDPTYLDIPLYIFTGGTYRLAKSFERTDQTLAKYVTKNIFGPQALVDRNISLPYEPGSVFKPFTVGIGLDQDEISLYDFYQDTNEAKVGIYTIKNADKKACLGYNSFLHALIYSCNVGMVKIANGGGSGNLFGIGKESFYSYLEKLGFGRITGIELAGESEGFVENVSTVALSRFLNNTFGQGLLVTPLQMAAAYAPLVNSGYYVKPTILAGIGEETTSAFTPHEKKVLAQIFKPETTNLILGALFSVLNENKELKAAKVEGYRLGGKSGTSQISYKGKYQQGIGWTNASFIGVITADHPQYIVTVQVRRPRSSIWGSATAAKIFGEVAKFLINYSLIVE